MYILDEGMAVKLSTAEPVDCSMAISLSYPENGVKVNRFDAER